MDVFTQIDDTLGLIRMPKGVYKQVRLYRRRDRVYVPHAGGFIEVRYPLPDDGWGTSHPDIKLLEHDEHPNIHPAPGLPAMRYTGE